MSYRAAGDLIVPTMITPSYKGALFILTGIVLSPYSQLAITLAAPQPGTYSVAPTTTFNPASIGVGLTLGNPVIGQWRAQDNIGGGSITFTTLNATGATGTFSFALESTGAIQGTATKAVTDGVFNVKF